MTSDKKGIALLTEIFVKKGLKHIVISPGSRNAPIIISFAQNPKIEALSIVDERSAAFFAHGMAQQTKQTVAIACTSGTAALNYAPAIAEAYYQKVPLLVLTADRPKELIDQGEGQTIRQKNVYANYIKKSFELPQEINSKKEFKETTKIINEAINLTKHPDYGPVHINIPFDEPLYNQVEKHSFEVNIFEPVIKPKSIPEEKIKEFAERWNGYEKKLLIAGMMDPNPELNQLLKKITEDESVVFLSETTSNLKGNCSCIDKVVSTISEDEIFAFQPELLVTFGGPVISKKIKAFIKNLPRRHEGNKPIEHWHIDPTDFQMDTYQCLTSGIPVKPTTFFGQILPLVKLKKSKFNFNWIERDKRSENRHAQFLSKCEFSDLKVFETILKAIPKDSNLQMGNSTPVRYVQLFKPFQKLTYNSNRGTSGIDGTISTAAGAAYVSEKPTTIITGDLGFFYDSNALMNNYLSENLRIIIINNSGGGIFRFIPGPGETDQLEEFFETKHNWKAQFIAKNFNIPYYSANHLNSLNTSLKKFYKQQPNNKPAILEVFTPNEKNAVTLKEYFKYLNFKS